MVRLSILFLKLLFIHLGRGISEGVDDGEAFLLQQQLHSVLEYTVSSVSSAAILGSSSTIHAALNISHQSRVILVSVRSLGLANRLRVVASAALAAKDTGRRLVIDWKSSEDCGADWLDLFMDPADIDGTMTLFQGQTSALDSLLKLANYTSPLARLELPGESPVLVWRPRGIVIDFNTLLGADQPSIVVLKSGPAFFSYGASCQETYHRKRMLYTRLFDSLAPEVSDWLSDLLDLRPQLLDKLLVGVHVRSHDATFDWPVVTPLPSSSSSSLELGGSGATTRGTHQLFDDAAPMYLFEQAMAELGKRFQERLHFFIASNSEDAKNHLVGMFGADACTALNNAAYAPSGSTMANRTDTRAVQRGLLDLVLLSRSALVVHSFGSSFGEEAAVAHLVPSVRLRVGGHLFGVDLSMPHCNNAVFENGFKVAQEITRFQQEADSDRTMASATDACLKDDCGSGVVRASVVTRSPCEQVVRSWGISGVFC